MRRVKYVRHAKLRLRERLIEENEVKRIIESPFAKYYDMLTGCFVAIGARIKREGHSLMILYEGDDAVTVISVIDTSKADEIASRKERIGRWVKVG
jgi:hypothetical protein